MILLCGLSWLPGLEACVVGEEVEVVMVHPRARVYSAVQERVVLITEETTLLYGPGVGA